MWHCQRFWCWVVCSIFLQSASAALRHSRMFTQQPAVLDSLAHGRDKDSLQILGNPSTA
jgi:hypothetical protein